MNSNIRFRSSAAAVIAAGFLAVCGHSGLALADPADGYGQARSAQISPDIKGFDRDGSWRDGGWQAVRDQQPGGVDSTPIATTHALTGPELGSSLAASALGLLIGGLVVLRGRLRR